LTVPELKTTVVFMKVTVKNVDDAGTMVAVIVGRLDAAGAAEASPLLKPLQSAKTAILDLSQMDYLSSAGVRIFLSLHKSLQSRGLRLILAAPQHYCTEVIRISGLAEVFQIHGTVNEALEDAQPVPNAAELSCGKFTFHPGESEPTAVEVLGNVEDVLHSRINAGLLRSKRFSSKEYSIGLGALGSSDKDVLNHLGEMMTIGGTMVWLPTDGNDTPDYLVPKQDSAEVVIRTGFNVSLAGRFNEYVEFEATAPGGATLFEIYRALFDLARQRRGDFRGALGLAMRAEMGEVYGSGVVRSPIDTNAPANGKSITDVSNFASWFEFDEKPRHKDVTGLICGVGLDLDADLSCFDRDRLGATFYLNPANAPSSRGMLHNHGVFFTPQALGEKPLMLEREIARVVELGDFVDMRHMLDRTTIVWALIGICYIQEFRADPAVIKAGETAP